MTEVTGMIKLLGYLKDSDRRRTCIGKNTWSRITWEVVRREQQEECNRKAGEEEGTFRESTGRSLDSVHVGWMSSAFFYSMPILTRWWSTCSSCEDERNPRTWRSSSKIWSSQHLAGIPHPFFFSCALHSLTTLSLPKNPISRDLPSGVLMIFSG